MKRTTLAATLSSILVASFIGHSAQVHAADMNLEHHKSSETKKHSEMKQQSWRGEANDAWIDGKIEAMYLFNDSLNSFSIDTNVERGVVILSGEVDTPMDSTLASELAQGVDGVKQVKNNLMVVYESTDTELKDQVVLVDEKIENVIKNRLLANSRVSGTTIMVDSEGLAVTLSGTVRSELEQNIALEIAKNANDVQMVTNELEIVTY